MRKLPSGFIDSLLTSTETLTVAGSIKRGDRANIYFKRVRYTSPFLLASNEWIGQKVLCEIKGEDLRTLRVYNERGVYLTEVRGAGAWGQIKHDLSTRLAVNRLKRLKLLPVGATIVDYSAYIGQRIDAGGLNTKTEVSELAHLARASGMSVDELLRLKRHSDTAYPESGKPPSRQSEKVNPIQEAISHVQVTAQSPPVRSTQSGASPPSPADEANFQSPLKLVSTSKANVSSWLGIPKRKLKTR